MDQLIAQHCCRRISVLTNNLDISCPYQSYICKLWFFAGMGRYLKLCETLYTSRGCKGSCLLFKVMIEDVNALLVNLLAHNNQLRALPHPAMKAGRGKSCSTTKPRPTTPELKNRVLHPAYHPPGEDWKRTWLYSSSIFQQIASHHFPDDHPTKRPPSKAPASHAKKSRSSESRNDGLSDANKRSLSS